MCFLFGSGLNIAYAVVSSRSETANLALSVKHVLGEQEISLSQEFLSSAPTSVVPLSGASVTRPFCFRAPESYRTPGAETGAGEEKRHREG